MLIVDLDIELMADATGHKPSEFSWFLCQKELIVFPTAAVKRGDLIFWQKKWVLSDRKVTVLPLIWNSN